MLAAGEQIPADATVWLGPNERLRLGDVVSDGPVLLFFYLFDWTST